MKTLRASDLVPRKKNPKVPAEFQPAKTWTERLTGWFFKSAHQVCVSWGGGVDSTAMIIGLVRAGVRNLVITHAETGSEWPETVAYRETFRTWLRANGLDFTQVQLQSKKYNGPLTVIQHALNTCMLPSPAFAGRSCSVKFKVEVQKKWRNAQAWVRDVFSRGQAVVVFVGYECTEYKRVPATPVVDPRTGKTVNKKIVERDEDGHYCSRRTTLTATGKPTKAQYHEYYPLMDWGWDRDLCEQVILDAGLPVPRKSCCTICPHHKPWEVVELKRKHPELFAEALHVEANGVGRVTYPDITGLGGRGGWSWAGVSALDDALLALGIDAMNPDHHAALAQSDLGLDRANHVVKIEQTSADEEDEADEPRPCEVF
jgi:3'-phosphoadenosine 5'-phosphosulfate sulfotransferase (PAPS reductase)/FAD synthetase